MVSGAEWEQIRSFIKANSLLASRAGYRFRRTQVRDLNYGRKIETIALVPPTAALDQVSWSLDEARRIYDLMPYTPKEHDTLVLGQREVFRLHQIASLRGFEF